MPLLRRNLLPVALLTVLAAPLNAQQSPAPAPADSTRAFNTRMKSDLRNLVTAQEARYAQASSYARTVAELAPGYRASPGVTVEIVNGGPNGYGAVARTAGREGSCVIGVGIGLEQSPRTDLEKKAAPEGEPTCDGDGLTERAAFAREAEWMAGSALMRVAKLEERHFGRTGAYAADLAALPGLKFAATVAVSIELANAPNGEAAFLAIATDSRYPGYSCVLSSGWARFGSPATTLAEKKHAGGGSIPVCDLFQ